MIQLGGIMKKVLAITSILLLFTGCFKRDSMEGIDIYTTSYATKYIMTALYGSNSNVESIYPKGIIIDDYTLTDKQIKDYSDCSLFVFNGNSNEGNYVIDMFKHNKNIKIIDSTSSMEYEYGMEELWLNPSNLLMMAQNVKMGLDEYITNHYLLEEINTNYEEFKIKISNLDADIRLVAEEANYKTIVVANDLFKFLGKYGLEVISLDDKELLTEKTIAQFKDLVKKEQIKYVYVSQNSELSDEVKKLIEDEKVEIVYLHTLSNISESEENNKKDYVSIMQDNIEALKKELNK